MSVLMTEILLSIRWLLLHVNHGNISKQLLGSKISKLASLLIMSFCHYSLQACYFQFSEPKPLFSFIPIFQMKFFMATLTEAHSKVFYNLLNTCCRVLFPLPRSLCIRPYVWRIYGNDLMYLNTKTLIVSSRYTGFLKNKPEPT